MGGGSNSRPPLPASWSNLQAALGPEKQQLVQVGAGAVHGYWPERGTFLDVKKRV